MKILFGPQIVCPGFWQLSLDTTPQENVCHAKQPLAKSGPHFTYTEPRETFNSLFEKHNLRIMISQFWTASSDVSRRRISSTIRREGEFFAQRMSS